MFEELSLAEYSKEELEDLKLFLTQAKKLTYQEEKNLPDSAFCVVITKKGKGGKVIKKRMYPIKGTPDDKTRVRSALRYLGMPRNQQALRKLGVSVKSVLRKILQRAKELGMKDLLKRRKKEATLDKTYFRKLLRKAVSKIKDARKNSQLITAKKEKFVGGIKKLASKVRDLRQQNKSFEIKVASLQKDVENAKTFSIEQATKAIKRREELGDFAKGLVDADLVDETKYEIAKAKKIIAEKEKVAKDEKQKKDLTTASLNVGDKELDDIYAENRKKVDEVAFGKPKNQQQ